MLLYYHIYKQFLPSKKILVQPLGILFICQRQYHSWYGALRAVINPAKFHTTHLHLEGIIEESAE